MTYLFESILALITEVVVGIMEFFTGDFWENLTIVEINNGKVGGYFDDWLPGVATLKLVFQTIAATIVFLLMFIELFKAFLPDTPTIKQQNPLITLGRAGISFFCIAYAYSLIAVIQLPMAKLCEMVYDMPVTDRNGALHNGQIQDNGLYYEFGDGIGGGVSGNAGRLSFPTSDGILDIFTYATGTDGSLPTMVLSVILVCVVAWAFIRLIFEMVERYVILGFLFYVSPLPMAALASEGTHNIFKSFMRMLLSQYLLIMFNFCFLFVFCYAFTHQADFTGTGEKTSVVLIYYIFMIAWLRLGRSLDEHMSSLGLSVAQTGSGLAGDILGGMMVARVAAGMAMQGFRMARSGASKLSDRVNGERAGAGMDGNFRAGNMQNMTADHLNHRYGPSMSGPKAVDAAANALGLDPKNIADAKVGNGQIDITDKAGNTMSFTPAKSTSVPADAMQTSIKGSDGQTWVGSVSGDSIGSSPMVSNAINDGDVRASLIKSYPQATVDKSATGVFTTKHQDGSADIFANASMFKLKDGASSSIAETIHIGGQQYYKLSATNRDSIVARVQHAQPLKTIGDKGVDFIKNKL